MNDGKQNIPLQEDDNHEFTSNDLGEVLTRMLGALRAEPDNSNEQSADQ